LKLKSENLEVRNCLGNLGIDGRIILKWILSKQGVMVWTGFTWLRIGSSGEFLSFSRTQLHDISYRNVVGNSFGR
jgi:hypothetical protein